MTPRPFRTTRPRPSRKKLAPVAVAAPPPPTAPHGPAPSALRPVDEFALAQLQRRLRAVLVVSAPASADVERLVSSFDRFGLVPQFDGLRLHELSNRSPVTAGGGYVACELAPVHPATCAILAGTGPCDCGAQALFEALVLNSE